MPPCPIGIDAPGHMGSHSVTCHPAKVTFPPLPQPIKAGTRFIDPERIKGWVNPRFSFDGVLLVGYSHGRVLASAASRPDNE